MLTGGFVAFKYFFYNFAPNPDSEPIICDRVYNCIKKVSDPGEIRERAAYRASLELITSHSSVIQTQLTNDWSYWHILLKKWTKSTYEDRKIALNAIVSFYKALGIVIQSRTDPKDSEICNYFKIHFRDILMSPLSKIYEIRVAANGIGLMAGAMAKYDSKCVNELLTLVIQKFEFMYTIIENNNREVIEHLPAFVQALSHVMGHVEHLSANQTTSLQNIIRTMVRDFHHLSQAHHQMVISSLMKTFYNLSKLGGRILDNVLDKCIFEGVVLTCSHKLIIEVDWVNFADWKDNVTYKNYLPLWLGLLTDSSYTDYNQSFICGKIYDKLIETLLKIIGKLNVNTKKRSFKDDKGIDQELYFCDPNIDLAPVNPHDFRLLFNLVDFYRDILKDKSFNIKYGFEKWIPVYSETLMIESIEHPLVSAYLKLLANGLRIADHIYYFTGENAAIRQDEFNTLSEYIRTIIIRTEQSSGELQIACLILIFASPTEILITFDKLSNIFIIAFNLGKNLLWLASYALTKLEKVTNALQSKKEKLDHILKTVLPSLDSYLISKGFEMKTIVGSTNTARLRRKVEMKKINTSSDIESDLIKIQRKIILFLGKLSPNMCLHLISNDLKVDETKSLVKWEVGQKLRLSLHQNYDSNILIVYLDNLIPQTRNLALTSSDRRTKISACELIHASVIILLGADLHRGEMWSKLIDTVFFLGCDSDTAVQEMFQPLLLQIMHYISQPTQLSNIGTEIILDCMMNLISHPSNYGLRDLAAKCLREYVEWIIKHSVDGNDRTLTNIFRDKIVGRIINLSFDSNQNCRFGAALAFNNIYRILREEEDLIKVYWLEFLYVYCTNFSMCEDLSHDLDHIEGTIDHIARVIYERPEWFVDNWNDRVVTIAFSESNLKGAITWIFEQCGSRLINYRRKCMEIYIKLINCLTESSKKFLNDNFTRDRIYEIFEINIQEYPKLSSLQDKNNLNIIAIRNWFYDFLSALDCWTWILNEDLIANVSGLLSNSNIFSSINYYLNELCWTKTETIFEQYLGSDIKIIDEKSKIDKCKCQILIMIMNFLIVSLDKVPNKIPNDLWSENLKKLLFDLIFGKNKLDLDFKNRNIMKNLPLKIEKLISLVCEKSNQKFCLKFNEEIGSFISTKMSLLIDVVYQECITVEQNNNAKGILFVLQNIEWFKINKAIISDIETTRNNLINGIVEQSFESRNDVLYVVYPVPSVKLYTNILLEIFMVREFRAVVLEVIANSMVLLSTDNIKISKGDHFLNIYRDLIFQHFYNHPAKFIDSIMDIVNETKIVWVIDLISELCEYIFKLKKKNLINLSLLIDSTLKQWETILQLCEKNNGYELNLLRLMSNLAVIHNDALHKLGEKAEGFNQWLLNILIDQDLKLDIKSKAIQLLPLISSIDHEEHPNLLQSLTTLQLNHFPLRSHEFAPDSVERSSYVIAFQHVLDAVTVSRSQTLLHYLIKITAADPKHIIEWQIKETLNKYIRNLKTSQQIGAMNLAFNIFCDESLESSLRHNILRRFVITLIQSAHTQSLMGFFKENIKKINELTLKSLSLRANSQNLVSRIGGYTLIELYTAKIPLSLVINPESEITRAYFSSDLSQIKNGKELIRDFMKRAYTTRGEYINQEAVSDDLLELIRTYHCAVYNALLTIVSNSQIELKFYESLLFKEKSNEFIWKNLINIHKNDLYQFEQDFEEYPKLKDRIISIRGISDESCRPSIKYIQTSSVFESSLSQDLTKIDLTNSIVRDDTNLPNEMVDYENVEYVRLEKMPINDHEVMANICATIRHMFNKEITPISEDGRKCPEWIKYISSVMTNTSNHKNVRLFLAKVIENCRHVMKAYAPHLLQPLLQVIADECAGSYLNSFVIDLLTLLLSWHSIHIPSSYDEISYAKRVLEFAMKSCFNEKRDIMRHNLELIKTLVEVWKSSVSIPSQMLYDMIKNSTNPQMISCGIHLIAIVLANKIVPWSDLTKNDFIDAICLCINNDATVVYQSASQLIGLCFAHLNISDDEPILKRIKDGIFETRKRNEKKSVDILYNMHKHYPQILDSFLYLIRCNLPNAIGALKRMSLEMVLARIGYVEESLYRELYSMGIRDFLKQSDYQLLSLHILNRALPKFSHDEIGQVLNDIIEFVESSNRDCRDVTFEILIYINDIPQINEDIRKKASSNLLIGLTDTDQIIQSRIFNYWSTEKHYINFFEKITSILELYDPKTEKHFLNYATQLLLDPIIKHPHSKEKLFMYQEDQESKFSEYTINTKWQTHASTIMSPLFVESQSDESLLLGRAPLLRATQNQLKFEPTQDLSTLSQSIDQFTISTQSAFIFDHTPQILNRRSQVMTAVKSAPIDDYEAKFRKRFTRDPEVKAKSFALKAVQRRQFNQSQLQHEMKRKEKEVILYRRYRDGDYPDLLITSLAVLLPLQALINRDPLIARHVFVSLFTAAIKNIGRESDYLIKLLGVQIENILTQTRQWEPILIGTLMEITLIPSYITPINPNVITLASTISKVTSAGIIYLENRLSDNIDCDSASKRSNNILNPENELWIKLSELYNELCESDIVASIYSDKLQSNPALLKGIQYENDGNYKLAQEEYLRIINAVQNNPVEQDFCFLAYFNCFASMGQWADLTKAVSDQVSSFDDFWSEWNKENLLPHYIHAELRLILSGDLQNTEFLNIMESWLRNPERQEYLTLHFSEEIMMLQIANSDYLQSRVLSEQALKFFLSDWGQLSIFSSKIRTFKLLNMKKIAEIYNNLNFFITPNYYYLPQLIESWKHSSIPSSDSIILWDTILAYRTTMANKISQNYHQYSPQRSIDSLNNSLINMSFNLLNMAYNSNNLFLYEKLVANLISLRDRVNDPMSIEWELARCKIYALKSRHKTIPMQTLKLLLKSWAKIKENILDNTVITVPHELQIKSINEIVNLSQEVLKVSGTIGVEKIPSEEINLIMRLSDTNEYGK